MGFEEINPRLTRSLPLARPPAFPSMSQFPRLAPFLDFARNDMGRSSCWNFAPLSLLGLRFR